MGKGNKNTKDFGYIMDCFNFVLMHGILAEDASKKIIYKKFLSEIKKNPVVRDQWFVYNNILNFRETDFAKTVDFINTNVSTLSKYTTGQIDEANTKLILLLKGKHPKVETNPVNEAISTLITNKPTPKNVNDLFAAKTTIFEYVSRQDDGGIPAFDLDVKGMPNNMVIEVAHGNIRAKCEKESEDHQRYIELMLEDDIEGKIVFRDKLVKDLIGLVDQKLVTENMDTKERLLKIKQLLLSDPNHKGDIDEGVEKMLDLKKSLEHE